MNFIKKIFENKVDEKVHAQFTRYSKGNFENKAILDITNSKKIKIKTSSEFTNELVGLLANTIKNKTLVKGIIFSTRNLSSETDIKFDEIKSAIGVRKHFVNQELTKEQILSLIEKFPHCSVNLSFKTDYGELKVKEKAPKSRKPSNKEGNVPKADYCVLETEDKAILKDYAFDIPNDFKKVLIKHTFSIEQIDIPKEYANNFELARLHAKRKGKIIRELDIDGKKEKRVCSFSV